MELNIDDIAEDVGEIANATAKNITDAIIDNIDNQEPLIVRLGKFFMNTVINMVWYAGCFTAFMVGTVYFK